MTEVPIEIIRREPEEFVPAELCDGLSPRDLLLIERQWAPFRDRLRNLLSRDQWPESLHWDWEKKAPLLELAAEAGFGVRCEGKWQGVVLTENAFYTSRIEPVKPIIYISFVEIAPWNWKLPQLGCMGDFKGVGSWLFRRAVEQSVQEEFKGRVGLHALPQAESFYEKLGMTGFGPDPKKDNLAYYELSRDAATAIINEGGYA